MDPKCEVCTRELMEWRSHVNWHLHHIQRALRMFRLGSWDGKIVLALLNDDADALGDLGWRGNRIPF